MRFITKNDLFTIFGFLLFIFGMTGLGLSLVGLKWSFLAWLDGLGPVIGFVGKIIMVLAGLVIVALNKINWRDDN
jgi:hypothetical protein